MIMKDEAQSGYKPVQDDVLKTLGLAVIAGQGVEHLLSSCLTFPLHGEPLQTVEQLQILLERHSKATLGQLLKALRKRVDLHPFEALRRMQAEGVHAGLFDQRADV